MAIAGGVAIEIQMEALGRRPTRAAAADLDLVARSIDVVAPTVTNDFLVSHYHVAGPGVPKFMVQLVDPIARFRVDVFPDLAGSVGRARDVAIGGRKVKVLSLDDILDHKLSTLAHASPARTIDPKHARDARTIGAVLGRTVPDIDPGCLVPDVYGREDEGCVRCALSRSAEFPLAPKRRICELLGWEYAGR